MILTSFKYVGAARVLEILWNKMVQGVSKENRKMGMTPKHCKFKRHPALDIISRNCTHSTCIFHFSIHQLLCHGFHQHSLPLPAKPSTHWEFPPRLPTQHVHPATLACLVKTPCRDLTSSSVPSLMLCASPRVHSSHLSWRTPLLAHAWLSATPKSLF